MSELKTGDPAPAFALVDQGGKTVSLSDYKGRHLLVYFYPRAMTPGCTRQSIAVGEGLGALENRGIAAVGISPDEPERQARFDEKYGLGFPLLSDPGMTIARAYGAFGEKISFGVKKTGIIRSAFLIGPTGLIEQAWYKVSPDDTVPNAMSCPLAQNPV